jgi:predicted secreted protein
MSQNAIKAQGTLLQLGSGSPLEYDTIAEINSFNGPGGSVSVIDVTDLSSSAKEKIAGMNDNGQLSFECNFLPGDTEHTALRTAKEAGATIKVKIIFTDENETEWTFDAIVTGFAVQGAIDAVVKASVTLEVSGSISES